MSDLGYDRESYRGFVISYDPPPIPVRTMDWHYVHSDYDGAEDANDNRCGDCVSSEACKAEIDALLAEHVPDAWERIGADPELAHARKVLSIHEIRLIVKHVRSTDGGWLPIEFFPLPNTDELIMAYCPPCEEFADGRQMIWRASMLFDQFRRVAAGIPQPQHLAFPATHWRHQPAPPHA